MGLRSELESQALRRLFGSINADIEREYQRLQSNPRYWSGRRLKAMQDRLRGNIQRINEETRLWYENRLPELYLEGARTFKPDFRMTKADLATVAQISDQGVLNIQVSNQLAARDISSWADIAKRAPEASWNKVRGIVTKTGARYRPDRYADLVTIADANRTFNFGAIKAAERAGQKYVLVRDGAGCGLTEHDDPQEANGLVLTLDEALAHPLSHPYCVRSFAPAPNGGKGKRSTLQKAAIAATGIVAAGGVSAAAGVVALRFSPTLQRRLTEIVARANPDFLAFQASLRQTAAQIRMTQEHLVAELQSDLDDLAEAGKFSSQDVGERSRRLLGLNTTAPLQAVGDEYSSTYDFIRMQTIGQDELELQNSVGGHIVSLVTGNEGGNIGLDTPRLFGSRRSFGSHYIGKFGRASGRVGRDLSGSYSKSFGNTFRFGAIRKSLDAGTSQFMSISPGQLFKYRVSRVKYGFAQHFVLNPNGMLRAGFAIDPRTGYIIPNFRFLPKGPLRIYTEINRSRGTSIQGNILATALREIMADRQVGAIKISPQALIRKGLGVGKRFLRVEDFVPGAVQDILYTPEISAYGEAGGIIRRGRIPNALSVVIDGKRQAVDLLIRNGKFVTTHFEGQGRITSVSTTVRLILTKNAKFNIRTNLNLRALGLDSLKDIRHLHLRDLKALDLSRDFKIRSFSTELRFFGYTPWQINKILRIPWDDSVRLYRDAKLALVDGFQKTAMQFLGTTAFFADMSAAEITSLLRQGGDAAITAMKDGLAKMRREIVDDPLTFILRRHDFSKISDPVEIAYKRPDVIRQILKDDSELAHRVSGVANILSLTPEEIARVLDITPTEAQDMWHRANATMQVLMQSAGADELSMAQVPPHLRGYWGETPSLRIFNFDEFDLGKVALPPGATAQSVEAVRTDLNAVFSAVEDYFPNAPKIDVYAIDGEEFSSIAGDGTLAFYVPGRDVDIMLKDLNSSKIAQGYSTAAKPRGAVSHLTISRNMLSTWMKGPLQDLAVTRSSFTGWFPNLEGYNTPLYPMVHEIGHHLMESLTNGQQIDLFSKIFRSPIFSTGAFPEDLSRIRDGIIKTMQGREHDFTQQQFSRMLTTQTQAFFHESDVSSYLHTTIRQGLGEYGSTDYAEMVAEALAEGMMSPNPRPLARLVFNYFREVYA